MEYKRMGVLLSQAPRASYAPLRKFYDTAMLAVCHVRGWTSLCKGLQYSKAEVQNQKRPSVCAAL